MAARKKADKPPIDPERAEEIALDARSGTNWAAVVNYGPACLCGMKPPRECARHGVTR